jgi:hypothetical protein
MRLNVRYRYVKLKYGQLHRIGKDIWNFVRNYLVYQRKTRMEESMNDPSFFFSIVPYLTRSYITLLC